VTQDILILLVAFQLKHFLADYPLQTPYMLGKFKGGKEWILPLSAHSCIHAVFTLLICVGYTVYRGEASKLVWMLPIADYVVHFIVDRVKASPNLLGRFKPHQPYFWWALGADQAAHHLTHYVIIAILVGM
jgi:hypothetical protein